jgi:hypothetical protein
MKGKSEIEGQRGSKGTQKLSEGKGLGVRSTVRATVRATVRVRD